MEQISKTGLTMTEPWGGWNYKSEYIILPLKSITSNDAGIGVSSVSVKVTYNDTEKAITGVSAYTPRKSGLYRIYAISGVRTTSANHSKYCYVAVADERLSSDQTYYLANTVYESHDPANAKLLCAAFSKTLEYAEYKTRLYLKGSSSIVCVYGDSVSGSTWYGGKALKGTWLYNDIHDARIPGMTVQCKATDGNYYSDYCLLGYGSNGYQDGSSSTELTNYSDTGCIILERLGD